MIYCVPIEQYPKEGLFIEELKYRDENDFEWRIARINNGIMIRYFGEDYFKESMFVCQLSNSEIVKVNNTNCIFMQDASFDTFCEVRNVLTIGYTDDIWKCFEHWFTERFEHDKGMLESEFVK